MNTRWYHVLGTLLILIATMGVSPLAAQGELDVQGHRGARGLKPENTLPAFETALDLGVTTLELDLHFTADDVVVIWHDDYIVSSKCGLDAERAGDAPDPDQLAEEDSALLISQLTFEQLQAYRCDRNPGEFPDQNNDPTALAGDDYGIISLQELFAFVAAYADAEQKSPAQRENAAQVQFNIETKRKTDHPRAIDDGFDGENAGPFELAILDLVEEHDLLERVIIQSFDFRSLRAIRAEDDDIRLALLTWGTRPPLNELRDLHPAIWSPHYADLSPALVNDVHSMNDLSPTPQVIPWTVNDTATIARLVNMGVDGIISDRPDIVLLNVGGGITSE